MTIPPRPRLRAPLTLAMLVGLPLAQVHAQVVSAAADGGPGPLRAEFFPEPAVPPDLVVAPHPPSFPGKAYLRGPDGRWVPRPARNGGPPTGGGGPDTPGPDTLVNEGSETSVAIDVGNASNLVSAFNQAFTTTPSMMASSTANASWVSRVFPVGSTPYSFAPYDPWCTYGNAAGELCTLLIQSDSTGSFNSRCVIARSTNGGGAFTRFYEAANRQVFQDRAMFDIDRTAALGGGTGTTHDGKVYLCLDDYGADGIAYTASVMQTISPAGALLGETTVSTAANFRGSQMQPVAGISDGQVYIVSRGIGSGGATTILYFHEVNPTTTTFSRSMISFPTAGRELGTSGRWGLNGHRQDDTGFFAIDHTNGTRRGRLYVITNRNPNPSNAALDQGDVYLSYSTNGGSTWTSAALPLAAGKTQYFPMMEVDSNGWVHVAYYQNESGLTNGGVLNAGTANLYYTLSTDGGSTWSAPVRLNSNTYTLNYEDPPPDRSALEYYLIGDYCQIKATGTGGATTAYAIWTTYDKTRADTSPGTKRERVICTTIPPTGGSTGACCVAGACTDNVSQTTCAAQGGTFFAGMPCSGVTCPGAGPPNNGCAAAAVLSPGSINFSTVNATTDGPTDCGVYQDIWYRYTASCPGTAMVSITNATFIPMLAAYAGQSCPPGALLSCSPTGSGMISFPVTAGGVYTIRVGGLIAQTGTGTLTLTPPSGSGPTINQQPQNQTPCPSSPASFSVAATGPGTITYQWRFNSSNIPGATQSTYNIASAGPANVGSYACQVTGACGSTLSNSASLTLGAAPVITQQPAYAAVPQGSPASFSVAATGTGLTYQWRRNGTPLANGGRVSGATSPTLQISQVIASDDGRYDVAITGSCGGATSNPAFLCYPNCDLSAVQPILNVSDFICFQNRFSAGDAYANCDGSTVPPILNVSDFICFSSRYAGGCP